MNISAMAFANEPLNGTRLVKVTGRKTKKNWAKFIKRIADEMYPQPTKITLVMDNYTTHNASAFYETFPPEQAKRFEFVYTPKHGSWLNMAEIENHVLSGQCLSRHIPFHRKVKKRSEQLAAAPKQKDKLAVHNERCQDKTKETIPVI